METSSIAITAAETGHLVFSTLHTDSALSTIDRIVDIFPPYQQQQIRVQLSGVLEGVVAQQLLPKQNGGGRVAAYEVLLTNPTIQNIIREGKGHQLTAVMQTSRKEGMQLMDDAIYDYLNLSGKKKTSADGMFTLETVACLGACGLAPVMTIDGEVHSKMTPEAAVALINDIRAKEAGK